MTNLLRGSFPSLPGSLFFVLSVAPLAEASLVPLNIEADMTSIGLKLRPTDKTLCWLPQGVGETGAMWDSFFLYASI
jgi:hypothetical protein